MDQSTDIDAMELLRRDGEIVAAYLGSLRSRYVDAPGSLIEAIEYSLLAGGKRLRPTLVLETYRACTNNASPSPTAISAAGAMELIHTFSLVHDDLPAMDDDDLRRGRPTNHKVFGEALAILAGDAMVTMAFEILAADASPAVAPKLILELARASGPSGMIGGQVLDIAGENRSLGLDELQRIHRMKTGALLTASCRLGAIAGNASSEQLEAVTEFGRQLGLAFQIVDDLLDVTATPDQLGKATKKDVSRGKNTYPALLGIDEATQQAQTHLANAKRALNPLGQSSNRLKILADFVVARRV